MQLNADQIAAVQKLADVTARLAVRLHRAKMAGQVELHLSIEDVQTVLQGASAYVGFARRQGVIGPAVEPQCSSNSPAYTPDPSELIGRRVRRLADKYWHGTETGSIVEVEVPAPGQSAYARIRVKWDPHCGNKRTWLATKAEGSRWAFVV